MLICNFSFADTFIVTSNADNGPGTLREALQKAADNGTSVTDTILFNLPNLTRADRTIVLDSTLPRLSSHLIIDGTSENASPFGISDARVQIENNDYIQQFYTFFKAEQVTDLQIYGLFLHGRNASYGLCFTGLNDMVFGKPGKGNIINGFSVAFISNLGRLLSRNLSFQSNLFGIHESGDFTNSTTNNSANFDFLDVFDLQIGGLAEGEGNLLNDQNRGMRWDCTSADYSGYLNMEGNKIGTDRTGLRRLSASSGYTLTGYNDAMTDPNGTSPVSVNIINNICAETISLFKFKNYFKIQGNHFGVGSDNVTDLGQMNSFCLGITYCRTGIIGGDDSSDKNYIANYPLFPGLYLTKCGSITVSKNSFFCNAKGIQLTWILPRPKPFVTINKIIAIQVAGSSLPNSVIELFYDDECPGCEGKTYIGSTTADANGKWTYNGNNSGGIVATATDPYGATSEFSTATINTDSIQVKNASCGRANGSIKHLRVVSGTDWYWQDEAGKIIGKDTDLVNVPPGKYRFLSSIGGNSCNTESKLYEIKNVDQPSFDTTFIKIQQPTCGLDNGVLENKAAFNASFQYQWVSNTNQLLLNDFKQQNPFTHLHTGNYYLKLRLVEDSTCFVQYGPFKLFNQSGPTLNTDSVRITGTTCNGSNGSIKNITCQNATGAVYTAWQDSTGNIVGTTFDISGLSKGKYRLKFKDQGGCDTIITPYYVISDTGVITVDTNYMKVTASSCRGTDGSITKITSANADSFTWTDMASGKVVGRNKDIYGLPAGTYQLELNNNFGCTQFVKSVSIGNAAFLPDTIADVSIIGASCFLNNGAIKINRFSHDSSIYSFRWTNSKTNALISTDVSIQNLPAGSYTLIATDSNGCSQVIFKTDMIQLGKPAFDVHALKISADLCNSAKGYIENLLTRDSSWIDSIRVYKWTWYDSDLQEIGSSPNSLNSVKQGTYYATITDQFNCTVTSERITVPNTEIIPDKPIVNDQYILRNTSTQITILNPQSGWYELFQDSLAGSLSLAASDNGVLQTPLISADHSFYVLYENGDCLSPLSKVTIKVFDSTVVYVPNAFTPDNNQLNDQFHVVVKGKINSFHISVYNRFGNLVYSSNDINGSWDGTLKGMPCPAGMFVYVITGTTFENKIIKQKGLITLLR